MVKLNSQVEISKAPSYDEVLTEKTRKALPQLCTAVAHILRDNFHMEPAEIAGEMMYSAECTEMFKQMISEIETIVVRASEHAYHDVENA